MPVGSSGHCQKGQLEGLDRAQGSEHLQAGAQALVRRSPRFSPSYALSLSSEHQWAQASCLFLSLQEPQDSLLVPKLGCQQPWGRLVQQLEPRSPRGAQIQVANPRKARRQWTVPGSAPPAHQPLCSHAGSCRPA